MLYLFPRKCSSAIMEILTPAEDRVWPSTMDSGSFYDGEGLGPEGMWETSTLYDSLGN